MNQSPCTPATFPAALRFLRGLYSAPHRLLAFVLGAALVQAALAVAIPCLVRDLFGRRLSGTDVAALCLTGAGIVALYALQTAIYIRTRLTVLDRTKRAT